MDNPIRTLRSFISDKAGRMRTAAKETVDELLAPDNQSPQSTSGDSDRPQPDSSPDLHRGGKDADREASVAFGGHHQPAEEPSHDGNSGSQRSSEGYNEAKSHADEPATDDVETSPRPDTSTGETTPAPDEHSDDGSSDHDPDESSDSDPQGEDPGDAIGVLFDGNSNSVRRLHPVSGHPNDDGRHRQTRHLFVTTGESKGRPSGDNSRADVTLDVSRLELDKLELEVEDLKAQIALQARIAELVDVNVGADVELGEVELDLQGVAAEALLEVHLDEIRQILGQALKTLEQRPELITQALNAAERAADEVGDTAESTTENVGDVAESATDEIDDVPESAIDDAGDTTREAAQQASEPSIQAESRAEFSDDHSRN